MKIIKFGAGWCKPCERLKAVLATVDTEYEIELVDIEKNPDLASTWGIRLVPTLVLVNDDGTERSRLNGLRSKADIEAWINE